VREHLETFLAVARAGNEDLRPPRPAAERALREYLRCGIPAHGFARVHCDACKHEYLAVRSARFGAVLSVHRFGDALNSHVHFHVMVTDGVFSHDPVDHAQAIFHPAGLVDEVWGESTVQKSGLTVATSGPDGEVRVVGPGMGVQRAVATVRDGPERTRGRDRDEVEREIGGKDVVR